MSPSCPGLLLLHGVTAAPDRGQNTADAQQLHKFMDDHEKLHYFGEEGPGNYEVILEDVEISNCWTLLGDRLDCCDRP